MLVVGVCSTEMRDYATFFFFFLFLKKELHIDVLGARSTPSVPRERYNCEIIIEQFQRSRNGVNNLQAEMKFCNHNEVS